MEQENVHMKNPAIADGIRRNNVQLQTYLGTFNSYCKTRSPVF